MGKETTDGVIYITKLGIAVGIRRSSQIALANSTVSYGVSSVCILPQKDSIITLSWQLPIDPVGTGPERLGP